MIVFLASGGMKRSSIYPTESFSICITPQIDQSKATAYWHNGRMRASTQ